MSLILCHLFDLFFIEDCSIQTFRVLLHAIWKKEIEGNRKTGIFTVLLFSYWRPKSRKKMSPVFHFYVFHFFCCLHTFPVPLFRSLWGTVVPTWGHPVILEHLKFAIAFWATSLVFIPFALLSAKPDALYPAVAVHLTAKIACSFCPVIFCKSDYSIRLLKPFIGISDITILEICKFLLQVFLIPLVVLQINYELWKTNNNKKETKYLQCICPLRLKCSIHVDGLLRYGDQCMCADILTLKLNLPEIVSSWCYFPPSLNK